MKGQKNSELEKAKGQEESGQGGKGEQQLEQRRFVNVCKRFLGIATVITISTGFTPEERISLSVLRYGNAAPAATETGGRERSVMCAIGGGHGSRGQLGSGGVDQKYHGKHWEGLWGSKVLAHECQPCMLKCRKGFQACQGQRRESPYWWIGTVKEGGNETREGLRRRYALSQQRKRATSSSS